MMAAKTAWHCKRELLRAGVDLRHIDAVMYPVLSGMLSTHGVDAVKAKTHKIRKERKHGTGRGVA